MIRNLLILVGLASAVSWGAVELKHGRYIGEIQLDPTKDKIAVVANFFLESPEDLTQFPTLRAALKLTLGGYNTNEYITETFDHIRYDFENGILTFDDPNNDLVITGELKSKGGNPYIEGDVFVRSSAIFGKIKLIYETDEPGGGGPSGPLVNFIPTLDGQYDGQCDKEPALIQLQTARGLKGTLQGETETSSLSRYYGITGRIGFKNTNVCGAGQSCVYFSYGGGSYNFYLGKLILRGTSSTDECTVQRDTLKCEVRRSGMVRKCEFKKTSSISDPNFFTRKYNLSFTPDQQKELPPANPPKNTELSDAVRGTFAGYLHNETNNTYQFIRLNVMPFSFTENPHNPNQMNISSVASLHVGKDSSSSFVTQRFEPRSFYIRPGFTLLGPTTDSYISIVEWKSGMIRGILYSHAFGRVGTVQLLKGTPPPPPAGMETIRSFVGEFEGPVDASGFSAGQRWFRFFFPAQPNDVSDNLIRFTGSYNPLKGVLTPRNIERATFDPFTGAFGWIEKKDDDETFSNGTVDKNDNIRMYWPPAPGVFGVRMSDYVMETFKRK